MDLVSLVLARYKVVAKEQVKLELEALADKLTSKDLYVVFTKTKELKYDETFSIDGYFNLESLTAFGKKSVLSLAEEKVAKAKYAHVIKLVSKKILTSKATIDDEGKAFRIAKKLLNSNRKDNDWIKRQITHPLGLSEWIKSFIGYGEHDKKLLALGFEAVESYDNIILLSPKAFVPVTTYKLELPKEEKLDTNLTEEEKELLKKYAPDLGDHTSFRVGMDERKLEQNIDKMSDDDIAWLLMHAKNAMVLGDNNVIRNRLGFREICVLQLMNKNITKKERTQIAEYILDKAGVSFVGGPTLKKYISALAKTGAVDKKILKTTKNDELINQIYYGRITDPDELRKIDYKKYDYQLANNPHTPSDVLEKIVAFQEKTEDSDPEVSWDGGNPNYGDNKAGRDYWFSFSRAIAHPNYPLDKQLQIFEKYRKKYKKPEALSGMISTLWDREDLPKEMAAQLISDIKTFKKPSEMPVAPPACFDEKGCAAYLKGKNRVDSSLVDHPNVPKATLRALLDDDKIGAYTKQQIFTKLRESGDLGDKDVISKVKKHLKFNAPDDLLKHFGLQAWIGEKGKKNLKFTEVGDKELKRLKTEMQEATTHDDFTFEVVEAYRVDKQIHKDYPKMSEELGNIQHGLYHGTSMANAAGILAAGIDVNAESRTGQMFGRGFYLASSASKAAQYASDNFSKSGLGVVFKMDVALGKSVEWKYGRPEHDHFMYNQNEDDQKALKKYAKEKGFKDAYDIPRWHLTHDSVQAKKGLALDHDEIVVKDGHQINITEIIVIHKKENRAK